MSLGKRSREASEETLVNTTVYVVSVTLYKAFLRLPRWTSFTREDVAKAAEKQGVRKPPKLPLGTFEVFLSAKEYQVAIFRFSSVTGCRQTDSAQHRKLPLPKTRHKTMQEFTREPNGIRVGFKYVFGFDHPYAVQGGKIVLESCKMPTTAPGPNTELTRTVDMVGFLQNKFRGDLYITLFQDRSHFCPFSGGGDVGIFRAGSASVALLQRTASPEPEETQAAPQEAAPPTETLDSCPSSPSLSQQQSQQVVTPPREGEYRCTSVENKVSSTQSERSVTLQLQANMLLLSSKVLVDKLKEKRTDIKLFTCYGVQLGPLYDLKLLKLTLNFDEHELCYEELFNLPPCAFYPAFIDIALSHVLESLV